MNKSKKAIIALISILTALALFLVGMMSFVIAGKGKIFNSTGNNISKTKTVIFNKNYDLADFNSLKLDVSVADISFKQNDTADTVTVTVYGKKDNKFKGEIKDKILLLDETYGRVTVDLKSLFNNFGINALKIVVTVPQNFNYPIDISSSVGDINFQIPFTSKLDVELDTGNFNAQNLSGKFDISTDTGDIYINNASPCENSSAETDTGDITIENMSNINVEYETDMGDAAVYNNDKNSTTTLSLSTDTGDINVN